jgi:SNF2 family DNA or RNA helicase
VNVYKFKTKPYKHQLSALKRALKRGYLAVLWEPRLGKTKLIVDWACAEWQRGNVRRVLIVCPLSVIGVWEEEFEAHAPIPYQLHVLQLDDLLVPWSEVKLNICVVNYDRAWRRQKVLKRWHPDMVVADESHRLKKPSARRSMYMRTWRKAKYRSILTGTPTPKSYMDIYSQWVFLNWRRFGTDKNAFVAHFIRMGGYMGKQVKGYRNFKELRSRIRKDASIRKEEDVFDMPPELVQRVPVVLEPEAYAAYQRMEYELFLELKGGEISDAKNVAVKLMRLQQITGGWIKSDEGNLHLISRAKLLSLRERLENLWNDNERVVVFARFKPEVAAISRFGVHSRVDTYSLSGATRREDRDGRRRSFQTRSGPSLFVAQIQAGGLGIALHASHEVLFYSTTYSYDDYYQATRRIRGPHQKKTMRYQHLIVPNSIDTDVYENLRLKQNLVDSIMRNPKKYAARLEQRLTNRVSPVDKGFS